MIITLTNWERWQQTEGNWDRTGWVKLWRAMRGNPDWRRLSDPAARVLVDLMMSTDHKAGTVDMALDDLAFTLGRTLGDLETALAELSERDWITLDGSRAGAHAGGRAGARVSRGDKTRESGSAADPPQRGTRGAGPDSQPQPASIRQKFGPDNGPERIKIDPSELVN